MTQDPDPEHYGKGLANFNNDTHEATFIMDCASCGRQELKVNVEHLRVMIHLMEQLADTLGVPKDYGRMETIRQEAYQDSAHFAAVRREFDEMPNELALGPIEPSVWDK